MLPTRSPRHAALPRDPEPVRTGHQHALHTPHPTPTPLGNEAFAAAVATFIATAKRRANDLKTPVPFGVPPAPD
jgi:hypothetical protein